MNENLLARVRALLAKAESTEFEEEAEAFNTKAAELIAKYGIDEALLASAGRSSDSIGTLNIAMNNPYSYEKAALVTAVGQALRCEVLATQRGAIVVSCTVIGYGSDLERVNLLYTSLLLQAGTQVTRQRPGPGSRVSTVMFRKSWFHGFNVAVRDRLVAAETKAAQEATTSDGMSTELVLRDRSKEVSTEFRRMFPRTATTARRVSSGGYAAGLAAGARADLGGARVPAARRAAVGR